LRTKPKGPYPIKTDAKKKKKPLYPTLQKKKKGSEKRGKMLWPIRGKNKRGTCLKMK